MKIQFMQSTLEPVQWLKQWSPIDILTLMVFRIVPQVMTLNFVRFCSP